MKARQRRIDRRREGSPESRGRTRPAGAPSPAALAALGVALWVLAFAPLRWAPLGWLAPAPWLAITLRRHPLTRRDYLWIWLAATGGWLVLLEGVRRPHPILNLGWLLLSAYLGAYLPAFVALVRSGGARDAEGLLRQGWSWWWRAPAAWAGLEWVRSWLIGCSFGQLAHTQVDWPVLIQLADLAGGYGLSAMMIATAGCLLRALLQRTWLQRLTSVIAATLLLTATAAYGTWAMGRWSEPQADAPPLKTLLVQGAQDVFYEYDPERLREIFLELREVTLRAVAAHPDAELVVWPEAATAALGVRLEVVNWEALPSEPDLTPAEQRERILSYQEGLRAGLADLVREVNRAASAEGRILMIVGGDGVALGAAGSPSGRKHFNEAWLVDSSGEILSRYAKVHRVMFGEFIPVVDWFPQLYRWTPMPAGLSSGSGPTAMRVGDHVLSPSICFESTVPQLMRGQLRHLQGRGEPAGGFVNITNDGWFGRTAVLDLHFDCAVFRAVENRRPLAVAANNGVTAAVSAAGVVEERAPRKEAVAIFAKIRAERRDSIYAWLGDWPVGAGLWASLLAGRPRKRGGFWGRKTGGTELNCSNATQLPQVAHLR